MIGKSDLIICKIFNNNKITVFYVVRGAHIC